MIADDKNSGFQNSPTFLLEKLNQIYADGKRTRKFDAETKTQPNKQQPASLKQPMKNTTLRGLFAAAFVLVSGSAFAQGFNTSNASITANAKVLQPVIVTAVQSLEFGNVTPNNVKAINTQGGVQVGIAGADETGERQGIFNITKGTASEVLLSFQLPSVLNGDEAGNTGATMTISFATDEDGTYAKLATDLAGTANALAWDPTETILLENGEQSTQPYYLVNEFWVNLGGKLTPTDVQKQGKYKGTVILTASYN
jgi:hypothetical protein